MKYENQVAGTTIKLVHTKKVNNAVVVAGKETYEIFKEHHKTGVDHSVV